MSGICVVDFGVHILASFAPCSVAQPFTSRVGVVSTPCSLQSAPLWRLCVSLGLSAGGKYTVWQQGLVELNLAAEVPDRLALGKVPPAEPTQLGHVVAFDLLGQVVQDLGVGGEGFHMSNAFGARVYA